MRSEAFLPLGQLLAEIAAGPRASRVADDLERLARIAVEANNSVAARLFTELALAVTSLQLEIAEERTERSLREWRELCAALVPEDFAGGGSSPCE